MQVPWDVTPCCMVDVYGISEQNDASIISTLLTDAVGFSGC